MFQIQLSLNTLIFMSWSPKLVVQPIKLIICVYYLDMSLHIAKGDDTDHNVGQLQNLDEISAIINLRLPWAVVLSCNSEKSSEIPLSLPRSTIKSSVAGSVSPELRGLAYMKFLDLDLSKPLSSRNKFKVSK